MLFTTLHAVILWYVAFILSLEAFIFDALSTNIVGSICLYGMPCSETSTSVRFCTLTIFLHYIFVAFVLDFDNITSSLFHAAK